MFDVDTLIADCIEARGDDNPIHAMKEVLERAVARDSGIADALPPQRAAINPLHVSPELTVLNVVWAPGMTLYPHDHRMWASIGIYTGGEDNVFYRRTPAGLTTSGGKELRPGDIVLLGDDAIHQVTNPTSQFAGAIHVYGGDFFTTPRSEFDPETLEERPYDVERALQHFEEQNRRFASDTP
jgi:predicted metal-dependent enzyme (double-stranded beta helix superfamily)